MNLQARADVAIEIRALRKSFHARERTVHALDGVDLSILKGEFLCLLGPSGCGKTTLLNVLADLETPSDGTVSYRSPQLDRPLLSVVFQEQGIFPWLTVLENAAFGLRAREVPKAEREAVARGVLAKMGLLGFEHTYPRQLSGGMRQRVNLARAFANDPEILLMDEPFANLDEQTKLILQDDLLQVWEGSQKTVLFITHSLDEAIRLGDRIVVMTARPGRIKTSIPVALSRPRDVFELQTNEEYLRLRGQVWTALKEEVLTFRTKERVY